MVPPFPDPDVSLTIAPLLAIDRVPAWTITFPAFPGDPRRVEADISPPLASTSEFASTWTSPPLPVLPRARDATSVPIKLGERMAFVPSIVSAPVTLTETLPASPDPFVALPIAPFVRIDNAPEA